MMRLHAYIKFDMSCLKGPLSIFYVLTIISEHRFTITKMQCRFPRNNA